MIFKDVINAYRRKILHTLTRKIGKSHEFIPPVGQKLRILVLRPNHRLGNMLLITPLVQELITVYPHSRIEIFAKGPSAEIIFRNFPQVSKIYSLPQKPWPNLFNYLKVWSCIAGKSFDLVINAAASSSSGRIATSIVKSKSKIYGDGINPKLSMNQHVAHQPILNFRNTLGFGNNFREIPLMSLRLTPEELENGRKKLGEFLDLSKPAACLFTYATGNKCYPEEWWTEFFDKLQRNLNNWSFLEILPRENVSMLGHQPALYSSDIREIAAVIASSSLFIAADSGIMHLGASTSTATIGLFKVTNVFRYQPYGGRSKGFDTNKLTVDELVADVSRTVNGQFYAYA